MPIEFDIRTATIDDLEEIARMFKGHCEYNRDEGFNSHYNFDWADTEQAHEYFTQFLTPQQGRIAFMAISKGDCVGYAYGQIRESMHRTDSPYAVIDNIYIDNGYRCSGIGAALMEDFSFWAKEQGAKKVIAETYFENKHARKYYEKGGLHEESVVYALDLEKLGQ